MLTVETLVRLALPYGSNAEIDFDGLSPSETSFEDYWARPPVWPPDMFAIASLLAKRTGAYTFIKPGLPYRPRKSPPDDIKNYETTDPFGIFGSKGKYRFDLTVAGHAWRHGLTLIDSQKFDKKKREEYLSYIDEAIQSDSRMEHLIKSAVMEVSKNKKLRQSYYNKIKQLWEQLVINRSHFDVILPMGPWEDFEIYPERKKMFSLIFKLLIVSDEACTGIAQYYDPDIAAPWLINIMNDRLKNEIRAAKSKTRIKSNSHIPNIPFTFATDENIAPVLPKAHTTSLGCSLRSLSRNVCLAPMTTEVNASWNNLEGSKKDGLFNLLLIPFPFSVPHAAFKPYLKESELSTKLKNRNWRWFDLDQMWLPAKDDMVARKELVKQFLEIIDAGVKLNKEVNGIVMPEAALDYDLFKRVADALSTYEEIEVFIAGTSSASLKKLQSGNITKNRKNAPHKNGNFVCTAIYNNDKNTSGKKYQISVQHKHHRWKLNKQQIVDYGAAYSLNPSFDWWENINISTRRLNFWSFRRHSVLATIICEDLARSDPAQQVIRTVGPSLLISILMDGPQIKNRWPGLYSSSLSQDPGCSVLTLTSLGLLQDRANGGRFKPSQNIALWADQANGLRELKLANNATGMILNIAGMPCSTRSLDGRYQLNSARKWELVGVKDVFLSPAKNTQYKIMKGIFVPYRDN